MLMVELENTVVGKKLSEIRDVDFGTCYPLIAEETHFDPDATIVGIVCSEFGGEWITDGTAAWEPKICDYCGKPTYYSDAEDQDIENTCDCEDDE